MHRKKFDVVLKSVAEIFRVLAHPDRLRLIGLLQVDEMDVSQLQQATGISQSAVSQHLKLLKLQHLVEERREGKRVFYHLRIPLVKELVQIAIELQTPDLSNQEKSNELLFEMKELWTQSN